jgi:hypothetical protein
MPVAFGGSFGVPRIDSAPQKEEGAASKRGGWGLPLVAASGRVASLRFLPSFLCFREPLII